MKKNLKEIDSPQLVDNTIYSIDFEELDHERKQVVAEYLRSINMLGIKLFQINVSWIDFFIKNGFFHNLIVKVENMDELDFTTSRMIHMLIINVDLLINSYNNPQYSMMLTRELDIIVEIELKENFSKVEIEKQINFILEHAINLTGLKFIVAFPAVDDSWKYLVNEFKNKYDISIYICALNDYYMGTAVSIEAYKNNYNYIIAAFNSYGKNKYTPMEEVILGLVCLEPECINKFKSLKEMPKIIEMFKRMTNSSIPRNMPIIGSGIFECESGIHVQALQEVKFSYGPFEPELIGKKWEIFIGKHSGKVAIESKARALGFNTEELDVESIVQRVKNESIRHKDVLDEDSLVKILKETRNRGSKDN